LNGTKSKVEAFFAKEGRWRGELTALRAILLDCGLTEEFKWRSPVYTAKGGNIAIVWGFNDYCRPRLLQGRAAEGPGGHPRRPERELALGAHGEIHLGRGDRGAGRRAESLCPRGGGKREGRD
jgi:hypothetical protein